MRNEKGFTLIELVMVIVLLGILAAIAIPKYIDLTTEAKKAAANGVLGAVRGAGAITHAAKQVGQSPTLITDGTSLIGALDGGLPSGWRLDDVGGASLVGICTGGLTLTDCDTDAVYYIKISTLQTATVAPAFTTGGTGTW